MLPRRLLLALLALLPVFALAAPLTVVPASVKLTVDVHASLHRFTGTVGAPAVELAGDAATGRIETATVRFTWADLKTGDTARDKELVAWAAAKSPAGVFTLAQLLPGTAADAFTAAGTLALNGQAREIRFPVTILRTSAGWDLSGEATIDHRDWGLPKIRKFGLLTVDPNVTVRFALSATPGA